MTGFWEPHSASIDFCESNYLHSNYIVEIHNTWSSILGISSFGAVGILFANPTNELRHFIAYFVLILIGVGSAGLHGTLNWIYQSSDELPMISVILSDFLLAKAILCFRKSIEVSELRDSLDPELM